MTHQEAFNTAAEWLLRPGATQALQEPGNTFCMYLTPDGNKCAIGCLLSDEALSLMGDVAGGVETVTREYAVVRDELDLPPHPTYAEMTFWANLQSVHDHKPNWISRDAMVDALKGIASKFNLNADKAV